MTVNLNDCEIDSGEQEEFSDEEGGDDEQSVGFAFLTLFLYCDSRWLQHLSTCAALLIY